jgi:hypothetical protein
MSSPAVAGRHLLLFLSALHLRIRQSMNNEDFSIALHFGRNDKVSRRKKVRRDFISRIQMR